MLEMGLILLPKGPKRNHASREGAKKEEGESDIKMGPLYRIQKKTGQKHAGKRNETHNAAATAEKGGTIVWHQILYPGVPNRPGKTSGNDEQGINEKQSIRGRLRS